MVMIGQDVEIGGVGLIGLIFSLFIVKGKISLTATSVNVRSGIPGLPM